LSLVPTRNSIQSAPDTFVEGTDAPQTVLFPEPRSGIVVFVCFPAVQEQDFVDLILNAQPRFVIDLRVVTRFDVGRLNRRRAFELFEGVAAQYVDLTGTLLNGASREDVMHDFTELISSKRFSLYRPVVFLLSRPETSVATDDQILQRLADSGKNAREIM